MSAGLILIQGCSSSPHPATAELLEQPAMSLWCLDICHPGNTPSEVDVGKNVVTVHDKVIEGITNNHYRKLPLQEAGSTIIGAPFTVIY